MSADTLTFLTQSLAQTRRAELDTALGYPTVATPDQQSTPGRHVPLEIAVTATCGEIFQDALNLWSLRLSPEAIDELTAAETMLLLPANRKEISVTDPNPEPIDPLISEVSP